MHELGHYLAAKFYGLTAHSLSVGFGRPLVSKKDHHGTIWYLRAFPIGGYVDLIGGSKKKEKQYLKLTVGAKSCIILGGVIMNLIISITLLFIANYIGFDRKILKVDHVYHESPAERMHMKKGDTIIAINNTKVDTLEDMFLVTLQEKQLSDELTIKTTDQNITTNKTTHEDFEILQEGKSMFRALGIRMVQEKKAAIITDVRDFSLAEKSGFRRGDQITHINNRKINYTYDLVEPLEKRKDTVNISILRNKKTILLKLHHPLSDPIIKWKKYGFTFEAPKKDKKLYFFKRQNFLEAMEYSILLTYRYLAMQSIVIYKLTTGSLGLSVLSGPIGIAKHSFAIVSLRSFVLFIRWLAIINICLAFINMLPIPILDGGQLVLCWIEHLKKSPIKKNIRDWIESISVGLIVWIFILVSIQDLFL